MTVTTFIDQDSPAYEDFLPENLLKNNAETPTHLYLIAATIEGEFVTQAEIECMWKRIQEHSWDHDEWRMLKINKKAIPLAIATVALALGTYLHQFDLTDKNGGQVVGYVPE